MFAHVKLIVPKPRDWDTRPNTPHVPVEALIALRKKRLAREMMAKTGLTAAEAVAYLHVVDYSLSAAVAQYKADQRWAEDNDHSMPASFKDFLKQRPYRDGDLGPGEGGARGGGKAL